MGKYIKKFDTHSDYEDFIETEDFIKPNVSYCVDNKDVHYNSIQTLFAIEFEAGKFAFGHASEDELFVATKDGLAQIWYADANGVITGYTPTADNVASAIIDAYNEHFGTDINIWTPETKTLQVGGSVPNWNAYEKIEMQSQKIAAKAGTWEQGYSYIIGTLTGDNFEIISDEYNSCLVDENGVIVGYNGPPARYPDAVKAILQSVGINAATITEKVVSWEVGSTIENWSEYTKYL